MDLAALELASEFTKDPNIIDETKDEVEDEDTDTSETDNSDTDTPLNEASGDKLTPDPPLPNTSKPPPTPIDPSKDPSIPLTPAPNTETPTPQDINAPSLDLDNAINNMNAAFRDTPLNFKYLAESFFYATKDNNSLHIAIPPALPSDLPPKNTVPFNLFELAHTITGYNAHTLTLDMTLPNIDPRIDLRSPDFDLKSYLSGNPCYVASFNTSKGIPLIVAISVLVTDSHIPELSMSFPRFVHEANHLGGFVMANTIYCRFSGSLANIQDIIVPISVSCLFNVPPKDRVEIKMSQFRDAIKEYVNPSKVDLSLTLIESYTDTDVVYCEPEFGQPGMNSLISPRDKNINVPVDIKVLNKTTSELTTIRQHVLFKGHFESGWAFLSRHPVMLRHITLQAIPYIYFAGFLKLRYHTTHVINCESPYPLDFIMELTQKQVDDAKALVKDFSVEGTDSGLFVGFPNKKYIEMLPKLDPKFYSNETKTEDDLTPDTPKPKPSKPKLDTDLNQAADLTTVLSSLQLSDNERDVALKLVRKDSPLSHVNLGFRDPGQQQILIDTLKSLNQQLLARFKVSTITQTIPGSQSTTPVAQVLSSDSPEYNQVLLDLYTKVNRHLQHITPIQQDSVPDDYEDVSNVDSSLIRESNIIIQNPKLSSQVAGFPLLTPSIIATLNPTDVYSLSKNLYPRPITLDKLNLENYYPTLPFIDSEPRVENFSSPHVDVLQSSIEHIISIEDYSSGKMIIKKPFSPVNNQFSQVNVVSRSKTSSLEHIISTTLSNSYNVPPNHPSYIINKCITSNLNKDDLDFSYYDIVNKTIVKDFIPNANILVHLRQVSSQLSHLNNIDYNDLIFSINSLLPKYDYLKDMLLPRDTLQVTFTISHGAPFDNPDSGNKFRDYFTENFSVISTSSVYYITSALGLLYLNSNGTIQKPVFLRAMYNLCLFSYFSRSFYPSFSILSDDVTQTFESRLSDPDYTSFLLLSMLYVSLL